MDSIILRTDKTVGNYALSKKQIPATFAIASVNRCSAKMAERRIM